MTVIHSSTLSKSNKSIQYPRYTLARAERAIRCAPFHPVLYCTLQQQSVALQAIAGEAGVRSHYTQQPLSEFAVENTLLWLIQVGVLRREVDGQGLTDSFRLTPLGRQLVEGWQSQGGVRRAASWSDRLKNAVSRWVRL